MMPSLSSCSSAHRTSPEADESCIAPMISPQVNLKRAYCAKVEEGVGGSAREPNPPNWEVLAGMVERITYQNAENGSCVMRVKVLGHRELVTVVGHAAAISAGEWITATGEWFDDLRPRPPLFCLSRTQQPRLDSRRPIAANA
jgi:hypothetical protein